MDLYTDTPATAATPSATDPATQRAADALYPAEAPRQPDPAPNAKVQAIRDADPARVLYAPEKQYGPALEEIAVSVNPGGTREQLEDGKVAFAAVAQDVGFNTDDIQMLAARARALRSTPPTPTETARMQLEAQRQLREVYADRHDEALNDAKLLVARDGRLATFLERTGLGNEPSTILRLVELARVARSRGHL
jgi:hypothetical protein